MLCSVTRTGLACSFCSPAFLPSCRFSECLLQASRGSSLAERSQTQAAATRVLLPEYTVCSQSAYPRSYLAVWCSSRRWLVPSVFAARARAVISLQECATASLLPAEGEGSTKILFGGIKSPAAYLSFTTVSPRLGLPLAVRARRKENSLSLSLVL